MSTVTEFRKKLEGLKGQKLQVQKTLDGLQAELSEKKRSLRQHEQAREVVREVGLKTQQSLQFHIGDITSTALEAVFVDPYKLDVEFIQRRNKTECDLTFVRDGHKIDPLSASGVGAVDVTSFALRIASWSMSRPHTRNVIILDEPFRYLSENYQEQASIMLKELSQKLGLQFIIVTHEPVLANYADCIFEVKIRKGVSYITMT
jgi:DNA repair exonuclease SbcCD ATPase subunit